jgi:hypothetical protein
MSIYRGAGGASDATDDSTVNAVASYAASASTSAANAATSAGQAATSAAAAGTNATSAAASASNSATQASNSAASAVSAALSVTAASAQVTAATTQAAAALNSATTASTSAGQASSSATVATTQANTATTQAGIATTKAAESAASAASALAIYANTGAMNTAVSNASTSAANSAASAATATTKASEAAASAVNAASSASAALTSANSANSSASAAQNSANTATSAASTAAATAAANVTNTLQIYSNSASVSASNASASAVSAASSASNAATSAASSAAIFGGLSAFNAAVSTTTINANTATTQAGIATAQATQAAASAASATAIVTGVASNRPSIRPSLLLDFANTRTLDPRITFARASTATFYDDKTTAVAEQNLFLNSQDFSNAVWSKNGSTATNNAHTAPNGTNAATLLTSNLGATLSYLRQQPPIPSDNTDFLSVYVKYLNFQYVALNIRTGVANRYCWFDVQNGTVATNNSGGTASIQNAGNGWYRLMLSRLNEGSTSQFHFYLSSTDASLVVAGDGISGNYFWGAQFEKRNQITAYTPTITAAITNYIPMLQTAASGVARFDVNPVTRESLGLLIEESRTNLLTYSSEFDNADWVKSGVSVTTNTIVSPNGVADGERLVENTALTDHLITQSLTKAASAIAYTLSCYLKSSERNAMFVLDAGSNTNRVFVIFDLTLGTISVSAAASGTFSSPIASITSVGNGWYRCTLTGTTGTETALRSRIWMANGVLLTYTGNGYSGIFLWGAQLEEGASATSYIPTVTSQVTRAADSASMAGTNFSSWWRTDEGTLYVEGQTTNNLDQGLGASAQNVAPLVGLGSGLTNQFRIDRSDSGVDVFKPAIYYRTSASAQTIEGLNNQYLPNVLTKIAATMKAYDYAFSAQGGAVSVSTAPPTVIQGPLLIGQSPYVNPRDRLNGTIKRLAYYPIRLSNTELQGLTS